MKSHLFVAAIVAVSLLAVSQAPAATRGTTTVTFDEPITFGAPLNRTFDALAMDWSTPLTGLEIVTADLTDLTFRLLNGGSTLYTDSAIVAGVVQPIGGVARSVGGVEFFIDLNSLSNGILGWDNDLDVVQEDAANGETYNIYGLSDGGLGILSFNLVDGFSNGVFQDAFLTDFTHSTVLVPEPSPLYCAVVWLLIGSSQAGRRRFVS